MAKPVAAPSHARRAPVLTCLNPSFATRMNYTLFGFVVLYLLGTLALGIYAGTRVKEHRDFAWRDAACRSPW